MRYGIHAGMGLMVLTLLAVRPAAGLGFGDVDVEYWAGSGSNASLMVVDFTPAGGDSAAFGYRWDGSPTSWDMIEAVDQAGSFDVDADEFNFGGTIFHFINSLSFGGMSITTDPGFGANLDFPGFWISSNGQDWTAPETFGVDGRNLSDGSWDGWSQENTGPQANFTPQNTPEVPLAPAVPEPATATLGLLALMTSFGLRCRRRVG